MLLQPLLAGIALVSILYGGLLAWRQTDLKAMIAYSSVSHMGVVLLGIATLNEVGLLGAVMQMVAHGLIAGALFLLIGLLYERTHTRELADYGALVRVTPRFTLFITLALCWRAWGCRAWRFRGRTACADRRVRTLGLADATGQSRRAGERGLRDSHPRPVVRRPAAPGTGGSPGFAADGAGGGGAAGGGFADPGAYSRRSVIALMQRQGRGMGRDLHLELPKEPAMSADRSPPVTDAATRATPDRRAAPLPIWIMCCPGQAPILNFVHHNTLHGYQHLPFEQALAAAEQLTGIHAYLPDAEFRALYRAGRIGDADLDAVFAQRPELETEAVLVRAGDRDIRRGEVLRVALVHGVEALSLSQLVWRMEELDATRRFQVRCAGDRRASDCWRRPGARASRPKPARRWKICGGPVWKVSSCRRSTCIRKNWWICN